MQCDFFLNSGEVMLHPKLGIFNEINKQNVASVRLFGKLADFQPREYEFIECEQWSHGQNVFPAQLDGQKIGAFLKIFVFVGNFIVRSWLWNFSHFNKTEFAE